MTAYIDLDAQARQRWLEDGVKPEELDLLASIAPLSSWDIQFESFGRERDAGHFVTRLSCPKCGSQGTYVLNAVNDFHCDDDESCGFDVYDNEAGLQPTPGTF